MPELNVFISVLHHIKLRVLSVTQHPQEELDVSSRKESIINTFPYAHYNHIYAVLDLVSEEKLCRMINDSHIVWTLGSVYLFACTVQTERFIRTSASSAITTPNADGMWSLSQSWSREAFLIITSFFTRRLGHSLELCLSAANRRDMRKMPDQTASITRRSPGGLHLPLGLELPEPAGQDADTGAMQPRVVNSNWYIGTDVTLAR